LRREVRELKRKAIESLVLSIELFNRPRDDGRAEASLIHADRAFEMLLKAVIRHRGGAIRKPGEAYTIGLRQCVDKCVSDASLQCLSADEAVTLQALNGWRDAAQHYLVEISEQQLYLACQAAVTLFGDILQAVFGESLRDHVPERVLPVSTTPPRDLDLLMEDELAAIKELIRPGSRRRDRARNRLRSVAILDAATKGPVTQPTEEELDARLREVGEGRDWRELFPGVANLRLATQGSGLTYSLRISKKEGVPIRLVSEEEAAGTVIAVKRVNELDFYCHGFRDLADRCSDLVTPNKLAAVIATLDLRDSPTYFKDIVVGHGHFPRYSQEALTKLRSELPRLDIEAIWRATVAARRQRRRSA
jgi:hypothetical protein